LLLPAILNSLLALVLVLDLSCRELESIPRNTALYQLRKQHLQEMIGLKYEIQRLEQESQKDDLERQVQAMKKEHAKRDWILQQQQQLLEAKYRKHMAKENPINKMPGKVNEEEEEEGYLPELGLGVYFDFVLNLPSRVQQQVQVVYGFYEGVSAKTATKSLPLTDVETSRDGSSLHRAVMAVRRQFKKVPPNGLYKLIIEVQNVIPATLERGPRTQPVAWTMVRLFNKDATDVNRGLWRVPMFMPPIRPDMVPEELATLHMIASMEMFLRIAPAQVAIHVASCRFMLPSPMPFSCHFVIPSSLYCLPP